MWFLYVLTKKLWTRMWAIGSSFTDMHRNLWKIRGWFTEQSNFRDYLDIDQKSEQYKFFPVFIDKPYFFVCTLAVHRNFPVGNLRHCTPIYCATHNFFTLLFYGFRRISGSYLSYMLSFRALTLKKSFLKIVKY